MEIASVDARALSSPIDPPQERRFHGGVRTLHKRDSVLVTVESRDGERGHAPAGATSSAMREHFADASQRAFAELIDGRVHDALAGVTVEEPAAAHSHVAALDLPEPVASQAVAAVDVALYDLFGRVRGAPVHELLGEFAGRAATDASEPIPAYASAGMYMEPAGYARQARTLADCGFAGYKYRPGIGPGGDRRTVEAVADALAGDAAIMVDAHTWWKLEDAYGDPERRAILDACEAADVCWLEEPVAPDDHAGYAALAAETTVPLAGGESEATPDGLIALADTGAVDVLQGDVRHHRGFTGCLRAVERCRGSDVRYVPHSFGTALATVANAHLVAAAVEEPLLEYPVFENDPALDVDAGDPDPGMYPYPLAFEIVEEDLALSDGRLSVPDGPGLGVTVDESALERYPFREGPWTTFEYDGA